ncbi:splicing factor 3a [Delitschia confertaspora ATCC 74209]|uniref:Splicing factor 3a n=1 Tax=Delitschia confertaspora ATCC 74209 TaxID=1513339 RepID=A0A9P4JGS1_9PLEO|nr:splicing factor 3a [Delitschia confertaspora ATCC 74209]
MYFEDERLLHEDLERLEQAIADRMLDEPKNPRERLTRDHEVAQFLSLIEAQSQRLLELYEDREGDGAQELQHISTGDTYNSFHKEVEKVKDFYKRYPGEQVQNLEKAYRKRTPEEAEQAGFAVDSMFTGEEGFGRFFDLTMLHECYLNLPDVRNARRVTYLQYLDMFDIFTPPQCVIKRAKKMTELYYKYLVMLEDYLESFMRRTKPLENLEKIFAQFDKEFEEAWEKEEVAGWETKKANDTDTTMSGTSDTLFCDACQKGFANENVYENHLTGKKHKKAAQALKEGDIAPATNGASHANDIHRMKERAVAAREFRIKKLASAMQTQRSDTKVNVERKQGMTEKERQQELELLYSESSTLAPAAQDNKEEEEGDDKIYNPLKLPLAWDGKPIPYWLYKLHGLGVEFNCEICGNFVYMGRRAFDKHFTEPKHVRGLRSLGITNTTLFREITKINEAMELWEKIQKDKLLEKKDEEEVVEMEDSNGFKMPEKVYWDLVRQGVA